MKILYDHQAFSLQAYGGITRSFYEIMKGLPQADCSYDLALSYTNNEYLMGDTSYKTLFGNLSFPGKKLLSFHLNQCISENKLNKSDFDIFHPTYYYPYFLKYLRSKPFVLTIHDMIHELFPEYFPKEDKIAAYKKILAKQANHIIAVSENTKKDIMELLDIEEEKITVVYHGSSFGQSPISGPLKMDVPDQFILFVGNRSGYKNFDSCVKSLAVVLKSEAQLYLACAGGGGFSTQEKELFSSLGISDRILHFPSYHEVMTYLYMNALVFIFPSLYEGFGIPVLEAFSCGCPVILSDTSSLPEVGGEAAVYFDPQNSESLQLVTKKVLDNEGLRNQLRQRGYERLKHFSWKQTALKTANVYEAVINKGRV